MHPKTDASRSYYLEATGSISMNESNEAIVVEVVKSKQ